MSITLTDLTKRFGENLVVNRVSLEVHDGELFVLLGASGSGKSTILRLIAGLIQPDTGRIEFNGQDVTTQPPQARGIGFVFQDYSIFRHMTVAQNIEFGLRIHKVPSTKWKHRCEELLDLVGLTGLGERYEDQLSGGQQQRVALARALAYQPAVLLLDEPFGALDVKIRAQMRKSLKEIQRKLNVTTILVTHDQEEAFELADRIGVLERGCLIEIGTPEELYHRPRTEAVATFVGGGNVLVGRAEGDQIRLGSVTLPLPKDAPVHEEGAPVRILFRPETIVLQAEPFAAHSGVYVLGQGQVVEQIFAGLLERVRLEVEELQGVRPLWPPPAYGQRTTPIEAVQPGETKEGSQFTLGQRLWIGLRDYHVLEPAGFKILIHADETVHGETAADFGCQLARAARCPATLLGVADSTKELAKTRENLERLSQRWIPLLPRLETRIRQGASPEEILFEAQEGHYEMVILSRGPASPAGLGPRVRPVLEQAQLPVLLVSAPRPQIQRVLICTAAGEPGKADILFGGRLARRVHAYVTVFHVQRAHATDDERVRAERHLCQAQASLEALGVKSQTKVKEEPALESIQQEIESGDYDLIVIGASALKAPPQFRRQDLATRIVGGTTRPVMVVPLVE